MQRNIQITNPTCDKGTTAKLLATKLGFGYIDSGAMFRAVNVIF